MYLLLFFYVFSPFSSVFFPFIERCQTSRLFSCVNWSGLTKLKLNNAYHFTWEIVLLSFNIKVMQRIEKKTNKSHRSQRSTQQHKLHIMKTQNPFENVVLKSIHDVQNEKRPTPRKNTFFIWWNWVDHEKKAHKLWKYGIFCCITQLIQSSKWNSILPREKPNFILWLKSCSKY